MKQILASNDDIAGSPIDVIHLESNHLPAGARDGQVGTGWCSRARRLEFDGCTP